MCISWKLKWWLSPDVWPHAWYFNLCDHLSNVVCSTFHDCFQWIRIKQCGWQVGFPHSPDIAQTTGSKAKLCLSLHEVHCSCTLWNETLFYSFNVFWSFKNWFCFSYALFWWHVMYLLPVFHKLLEWSWHFTLEMDVGYHLITYIKNLLCVYVCAWKSLQFIPYMTEFAVLWLKQDDCLRSVSQFIRGLEL